MSARDRELGLEEEYIPVLITGPAAGPFLEYVPSPSIRISSRPQIVGAAPRPPVAQITGVPRALTAGRNPGEDQVRLKEVHDRIKSKVRGDSRTMKQP